MTLSGEERADTECEICPSCGGLFALNDGPTHAYLSASAGCWAAFNESMALHYSDIAYWPAHQVLTDAYALQHSHGKNTRAQRSASLHLIALYAQCELGFPNELVVDLRRAVAAERVQLNFEDWPIATVSIRDVDVAEGPQRHVDSAHDFGRRVCRDWQAHHPAAQAFCRKHLGGAVTVRE